MQWIPAGRDDASSFQRWSEAGSCPRCRRRSLAIAIQRGGGQEIFAALHPGEDSPQGLECQVERLARKRAALMAEVSSGRASILSESWFLARPVDLPPAAGPVGPTGRLAGPPAAMGALLPPCCGQCQAALLVHLASAGAGGSSSAPPEERRPSEEFQPPEPWWRESRTDFIDGSGLRHLRLANISGRSISGPFEAEAREMFGRAESLLQEQGAGFRDVIRTWIYLRDMERDYGALNAARREFFERAGLRILPASTGIGGAPQLPGCRAALSLYALQEAAASVAPRASGKLRASALTSPTFNEACEYGSYFSRGLQVETGGQRTLYLSGTAAIDREGKSVGPGSLEIQARRMLENIQGLLSGASAGTAAAVQAIAYLKRRADLPRFQHLLDEAGLGGIPMAIVEATICRPELLCEMELIAVPG